MDFFRVEHATVKFDFCNVVHYAGPYQSLAYEWEFIRDMQADHNNSRNHPLSYDDFGLGFHQGLLFGFNSIEKLVDWFDVWMTALEDAGFVVRHYTPNSVKCGYSERQCIADLQYCDGVIIPWRDIY